MGFGTLDMTEPRACIVSVSGPVLTPEETLLLGDANPWGVILMGRSCQGPGQVRALVDSIWAATGRSTMIFIDQEGGRVRRLRPPNWPNFPAPGVFAAFHSTQPEKAREACWLHHRLIAAELEPMGINADCAPVADLRYLGAHQIVGDRALGSNPAQAIDLCKAALDGLSAGGVAGVIKHIPGHGRAMVDSHETLPEVTAGLDELEQDFSVFAALTHAPMALTAHVAYGALDGSTPATLSARIIAETVRGRIGFDGLLMTDDLGMKALGGSLAERGQRALAAGCDLLLHCAGFAKSPEEVLREMKEIASVAPVLSGKALERARRAERATLNIRPFDRAEGWRRFDELLADAQAAMT